MLKARAMFAASQLMAPAMHLAPAMHRTASPAWTRRHGHAAALAFSPVSEGNCRCYQRNQLCRSDRPLPLLVTVIAASKLVEALSRLQDLPAVAGAAAAAAGAHMQTRVSLRRSQV